MTDKTATIQVFRIVIKASANAIWDAITKPEWTERYGYGGRAEYDLRVDGRFSHKASAEMKSLGLPDEIIVADDGSGPQTRHVVTRWQERLRRPLIHVWQADEGFRLARSRNRAIAAARGDYLVIVARKDG